MSGIDWWLWRDRAFRATILGGVQFVVISVVAMFFYAGGNLNDPQAAGYRFFSNFFSDLGRTVAHNGQPNTSSAILFLVALTLAGLSLILFFLSVPRLVATNWFTWLLALAGSAAGALSGIGFIGVAVNPADVRLAAHVDSVFLAFIAFFVAVVCHLAVIVLNPAYPKSMGLVYLLFAVVLGGYLYLLFYGPRADAPGSLTIQVTGQKAVVYAAVVSVTIQAHGARRLMTCRNARAEPVPGRPATANRS
jgi:hypothetical membrane protein